MKKRPKLLIVGGSNRPKKTGPKPWQPTPLERRTVERCMAIGFTAEQAAMVIGKSIASLERHCRKELNEGYAKVSAKIGGQLIRKALSGDTAAMIFFAKCRLGWNEKQILEHQGRGGGPIQYDAVAADADAFTNRIMALAERYADAVEAVKALPLIDVTPITEAGQEPPAPNEVN